MSAVTASVVRARPVISARLSVLTGLVLLALFEVIAVVMVRDNAGVTFHRGDQIATGIVGILVFIGCLPPTRPRLVADAAGVRFRGFFGSWKTVPWSAIRGVEFPSNARFARIVLDAEETLSLFAVQRLDRQRSIETMRALRALHAGSQR